MISKANAFFVLSNNFLVLFDRTLQHTDIQLFSLEKGIIVQRVKGNTVKNLQRISNVQRVNDTHCLKKEKPVLEGGVYKVRMQLYQEFFLEACQKKQFFSQKMAVAGLTLAFCTFAYSNLVL